MQRVSQLAAVTVTILVTPEVTSAQISSAGGGSYQWTGYDRAAGGASLTGGPVCTVLRNWTNLARMATETMTQRHLGRRT